ncbi:MAG: elongation factor G, partial [Bacteroidia bacterium]
LTPAETMGDVMTDLQNRRAIILGMDTEGNFQKLNAKVPLAELYKYATSLRSITQGRGVHSNEFSEYALVNEQLKDAIVKELKAATVEE